MKVNTSFSLLGELHVEFMQQVLGEWGAVGQKLIVHGHPRQITGDRLAVACVLLKGAAIGRDLDVGRKVSAGLAAEINRFIGDSVVTVANVEPSPPANIVGGVELVLGSEESVLDEGEDHLGRKRMLFVELPVDRAAGKLFQFDSLHIASNSHMFSSSANYQKPVPKLWSKLAVPVLFATDLSVSRIVVPSKFLGNITKREFERLAILLRGVEINLVVEADDIE